MSKYPNVDELFKRKQEWRNRMAALPIEKKMEIATRLRIFAESMKEWRKERGKDKTGVPAKRRKM